jgi:hypothetical protein
VVWVLHSSNTSKSDRRGYILPLTSRLAIGGGGRDLLANEHL